MAKEKVLVDENFGYVEKVDAIAEEDREFVRGELAWLGEWISEKTQLNFREVNRLLHEWLDVSV